MATDLIDLRRDLIMRLAVGVEHAVLNPAPPAERRARAGEAVSALEDILASYERLVAATSTSSNPAYALRDLPNRERGDYDRTKHAIGMLRLRFPIPEDVQ